MRFAGNDGQTFELVERLNQGEVFLATKFGQFQGLGIGLGFFVKLFQGFFALFYAFGIGGLFSTLTVADMVFQIRLALTQCCVEIAFFGFIDHHIGHDTCCLDGFSVRSVIAGSGNFQAGLWPQGAYGLHRALAKGLAAHDGGAFVVLQRTSDNFTGRSRAFIDQNDQRHLFDCCGQVLQVIFAQPGLAVVLRCGLVHRVAIVELPFG